LCVDFGLAMTDYVGGPGARADRAKAGVLTCLGVPRQFWLMVDSGLDQDPSIRAAAMRLALRLCLPTRKAARLFAGRELILRPSIHEREARIEQLEGARRQLDPIALDCAGEPGALLIERRLALRVVNAVLGISMPPFAGQLSRIERGIVEGTLATLLSEMGFAPGVQLREGTTDPLPTSSTVVELDVSLGETDGRAWLVAGDVFFERVWALRDRQWRTGALSLQLAVTRVPAAQIASAARGDALVFDETPALSPDGNWAVGVRRGQDVVPARWLPDGLVLADESVARVPVEEDVTCDERPGAGGSSAVAAAESAVVTALIDCPALDGAPGAPIRLSRGQPILLRVGDRPWAHGELTNVDGRLAVTITRLLAG